MEPQDYPKLEAAIGQLWELALKMGLDPFPTHFEVVPASILYEFGAYLLPGRFSHWTHGKAYYQMKTQYDYGLSKIYELVINNNPSYAFLLETNSLLENKFVVAHVLGHTDFFKHNIYFAGTNRNMLDSTSQNAQRIRQYGISEGDREVEAFLDAALSLADNLDPYPLRTEPELEDGPPTTHHPWADLFPGEGEARRPRPSKKRFTPTQDLLGFLIEHAPDLEPWQQDILAVVREESLYFVPQMQTKIMNEGWASFWHNRLLREYALTDAEFTDFARLHANVCTPGRLSINPYHVGFAIFEDIEKRFGLERCFEVRELENDVSFLRLYLTEELVEDLDLYVYRIEGEEVKITDKSWESVRDQLVENMTNFGRPYITVEDPDYKGHRELYLLHHYDGKELDLPYAERTLQYLQKIWGKPVHLETQLKGRKALLTSDGDVVAKSLL